MVEEERGPRVPRSQGLKDQDISKSHSNTSLTLEKVHLVFFETFFDEGHCNRSLWMGSFCFPRDRVVRMDRQTEIGDSWVALTTEFFFVSTLTCDWKFQLYCPVSNTISILLFLCKMTSLTLFWRSEIKIPHWSSKMWSDLVSVFI